MGGEFIYQHREEPHSYHPDDETFPIPLKYGDVMRQIQTSLNNVSQQVINDSWTDATGVNLSEEWTGTARFQIPRTRVPEGHKWVHGRPTKIQKITRPDSIWPEALIGFSKKENENILQNGQKKVPNCKQHAATGKSVRYSTVDKDYFKVIADARLKLEKYCSCYTVH